MTRRKLSNTAVAHGWKRTIGTALLVVICGLLLGMPNRAAATLIVHEVGEILSRPSFSPPQPIEPFDFQVNLIKLPAIGNGQLTIYASGDLNEAIDFINVKVGGVSVGDVFKFAIAPCDTPPPPHNAASNPNCVGFENLSNFAVDSVTIPNNLLTDTITITLTPSPSVGRTFIDQVIVNYNETPEPSALALVAIALGALSFARRRVR